jgi:hypothetical protein
MATTPSDVLSKMMSSPTLKGFIELQIENRRVLVALSSILAVSDLEGECEITFVSQAPAFNLGAGTTVFLKKPYTEIVELIKQAQ